MYNNQHNFGNKYIWNPWKGCYPVSEACANCYIKYFNSFEDKYYSCPHLNAPKGSVITVSLQSDFFLAAADKYRPQAWDEIRRNPDLIFLIITKRIERVQECLPEDWGNGWENVILAATAENQARANERIPILLSIPCKHKWVACTPLLEQIDLIQYLSTGEIEHVETLGEKTQQFSARPVYYNWMKDLSEQCKQCNVCFDVLYVGHNCIMPDNSTIADYCTCYHSPLADSLNLNYYKPITFNLLNFSITY